MRVVLTRKTTLQIQLDSYFDFDLIDISSITLHTVFIIRVT